MERSGVADLVVQLPSFVRFGALERQSPRLERADAGRDDDGTGIEHGARARHDAEPAAIGGPELDGLFAQVQLGAEGLDLLQQPIDEFLRAADRQGRNVINRLVGIQLGALPARRGQRIEHVRLDAEQPEFEDLEQPRRTGADDDRFGRDGIAQNALAWGSCNRGDSKTKIPG